MSKPVRFGSAISLVAFATAMAGCAAPQQHASSAASQPSGEVGLATRALVALNSGDATTAAAFAEKAVARTPGDATLRNLLGSAYFAAGRFASAETAFRDSLSIDANQGQIILKLALANIAQGKNAQALALLDGARSGLDVADYGLAVALAGRPSDAIATLEPAARSQGADARVRQNLALAYALSGDWVNARTIAAQDVPADQLDGRIHQWMQIANPAKPGGQLALLMGVTPVAADPGEPTQLALVKPDIELAQAAPATPLAGAAPGDAPLAEVAQAVPPPLPPTEAGPAPQTEPLATDIAAAPAFTPQIAVAPAPPPEFKPARVVRASLPKVAIRRMATGKSGAVVQIGAYSNAQRVAAAWNAASHRYGALRAYTPLSARFDSGKGTFYRLSVKGFGSAAEANTLCSSIRRGGGNCFVRSVAGDVPVQLASR